MPTPRILNERVHLPCLADPAGLGAWDVELFGGMAGPIVRSADLQGLVEVVAPPPFRVAGCSYCVLAQPFNRVAVYITGVRQFAPSAAPPRVWFEVRTGRENATQMAAQGHVDLPDFQTTGLLVQVITPLSTAVDLWMRVDTAAPVAGIFMTLRALIDRSHEEPRTPDKQFPGQFTTLGGP